MYWNKLEINVCGKTYTAKVEKGSEFYIGQCVELPKAMTQGKTRTELKRNMVDVIEFVLVDF